MEEKLTWRKTNLHPYIIRKHYKKDSAYKRRNVRLACELLLLWCFFSLQNGSYTRQSVQYMLASVFTVDKEHIVPYQWFRNYFQMEYWDIRKTQHTYL